MKTATALTFIVNTFGHLDHGHSFRHYRVHLLVRPDRIFPPRPYSLLQHGAQGRVQAGRSFSGHPQGLALTGRVPC